MENDLLLKAALLPPVQAKIAWRAYLDLIDLKDSPPEAYALFPLVYENLKHTDAHQLHVCKSVLRHTWMTNQLLMKQAKKAHELLQNAEIPSFFLKGAAMIKSYYKHAGLRVLGDVDLLVRKADATKALSMLLNNGWKSVTDIIEDGKIERHIQRSHAIMLTHKSGHKLDLHWSAFTNSGLDTLLSNYCYEGTPEDLLLHTMVHGQGYAPIPMVRWIPDSVTLLRHCNTFDWNLLIRKASKLKLSLFIQKAFTTLDDLGVYSYPTSLLKALPSPTSLDKAYYRFVHRQEPEFIHTIKHYWYAHARNTPDMGGIRRLYQFPRYVAKVQRFKHLSQLVPFIFTRLAKRARKRPNVVINAPTQFTDV